MINVNLFMKLLTSKQLKVTKGELTLFDKPIIFCPVEFLVEYQKYLENKLGYEKAKEILIEGFSQGGAEFTRNYSKKYSFKHKRDIIQWSLDMMSNAGWGEYTILEMDMEKSTCRFKVVNSPFARLLKSNNPQDHIIVGLIKGVAEQLVFEKPMEVVETICLAKGDSFCEIVAKPKI